MKPKKIIEVAHHRGLNGIVINDHNTIKGGMESAAIDLPDNFFVIVGAEIKTNVGDITGIFLKQEIKARNYPEVVQEIKNQNGLVVLNHPFIHHKLDEINFDGIDLIEGYNGRVNNYNNELAVRLAKEQKKPVIAGSDAHLYSEIGNCRTFYNDANSWRQPISTEYKKNSFYCEVYSQFIKAAKTKDAKLFLRLLTWTPKHIVKRIYEG
jgi:hypothetical protein